MISLCIAIVEKQLEELVSSNFVPNNFTEGVAFLHFVDSTSAEFSDLLVDVPAFPPSDCPQFSPEHLQ